MSQNITMTTQLLEDKNLPSVFCTEVTTVYVGVPHTIHCIRLYGYRKWKYNSNSVYVSCICNIICL